MSNDGQAAVSQSDVEAVIGSGRAGRFGRWRPARWIVTIGVMTLLGAVGYYLLRSGSDGAAINYRTDKAAKGDITVIVTATGTIQPTNQVDISSELSGIVRTVKVDFNSEVKVGQVLAELDTDKLKATVASSRAKLAAAEARVVEAQATVEEKKAELERKQVLVQSSIVSKQDLDTARAAFHRAEAGLASAQADVEASKADLNLDETNLEKSCICSPIKGVVLARSVEAGQVVAASLQAPVLFTIAEDLSEMEVQVDVDEADVGTVREGQQAKFGVDAYPGRSFKAEVKQLRFGSEVVQGVVTYKAVLSADNSELLLRPGMTATAEITVEQKSDVLTVSNEALRFSPPVAEPTDNRSFLQKLLPSPPRFRAPTRSSETGSQRVLWALRAGKAEAVDVEIGASDGRRTEIVSGELAAGADVIVDSSAAE